MTQTMGPLTTPFVEPEWCTSVIRSFRNVYQERGGACGPNGGFTRASECYPTGSPISFTDSALLYSPGIACPVGWDSVGPSGTVVGSTTVTCCPSGYSAEGDACWMTKRLGLLSVYTCSGSVAVTLDDDDWSIYPTAGPTSAFAQQVRLVLPSPDAFTTFTVTPTSAPDSEPKKKLSGGAISGIVIGVLALVLLLLFIGIIICTRRRTQRRQTNNIAMLARDGDRTLPGFEDPYSDPGAHQSAKKNWPVTTKKNEAPSLKTAPAGEVEGERREVATVSDGGATRSLAKELKA